MTKSVAVVMVVALPCLGQTIPPPPLIETIAPGPLRPATAVPVPLPHASLEPRTDEPLARLPYTPGLDLGAMDRTISACTDFYQHSCGGWMVANPIPPDRASWSVHGKLSDEYTRFLWGILEEAARPGTHKTINERKLGDYFASCMNQTYLEGMSWIPLQPLLAQINALGTTRDLAAFLAREHLRSRDGGWLFRFGPHQDYGDATRTIVTADAGGLSLPDRDYYTNEDEASKDIRRRFVTHVSRMLQMIRVPRARALQDAQSILRLETALARASLSREERSNPHALNNVLTLSELQELTPRFEWKRYLKDLKLTSVERINVSEPAFFRELDRQLASTPLAQWKAYLRWKAVHSRAPYLADRFVTEDFNFYHRTLLGIEEPPPRWKQCVRFAERDLADALAQEFVRRTFSPATKERALVMARAIEKAMEQELRSLDWMSETAKARALAKLRTITNKFGYPEAWKDTLALRINRSDFYGNVIRSAILESERQFRKIGRPVDREEWRPAASTVKGEYNPRMNDIRFPASALQPPLFDPKLDDAPNYGSTGSAIGQELIHAFDQEGRQFDEQGDLADWWTPDDARRFDEKIDCFHEQGALVDGPAASRLTASNDAAGLGGTVLAYLAWKSVTAKSRLTARDDLTPEQRFFIGFAQRACENRRPGDPRSDPMTSPDSDARSRINGVVSNLAPFRDAFACKADDPIVRAKPCKVW